jgi:hypothetical protein
MNFNEIQLEKGCHLISLLKIHRQNYFAGDCLELLRMCFIDLFDTFIAKVVLVIAFVNVISLTVMQTYYSLYYLDAVHFLKYAPVYFGRFFVSLNCKINLH